ncbi:cilia- and flagella-associated protein 144 isoform X4 [Dromaius novaehollandiae]|uniref:cilia- and flagella-associated protein 144 isoform X4 n=1 Tax=Dromaius novaehollandiae TaxID=8790 RepID=UPI000E1E9EA9|nr:protein FAM183A isoform X2 [Dromaius novaehollandiae]
MAALRGEKEPPDAVHQNQIFRERVRRELQRQRLHTEYGVNPLRPAKFLNLIHHAALEPTKKYSEPQTESQEIGWNTTPLIPVDRTDCRLHFPRRSTEITRYMAAFWRLKEQSENLQ